MAKKAIGIINICLIISVYVISNMGYAVHKCKSCDSADAVSLLLGQVSCDAFHHTEHNHTEHDHGHSLNTCCSTKVVLLTADQESTPDLFINPISPDFIILTYPQILTDVEVLPYISYYRMLEDPPITDNFTILRI